MTTNLMPKLVLIGEPNVGKTALIMQFVASTRDHGYSIPQGPEHHKPAPTVLSDYNLTIHSGRADFPICIFDTGGQLPPRSHSALCDRADTVILCISSEKSDHLELLRIKWSSEISNWKQRHVYIPVIVLGLYRSEHLKNVQLEELTEFAKDFRLVEAMECNLEDEKSVEKVVKKCGKIAYKKVKRDRKKEKGSCVIQ